MVRLLATWLQKGSGRSTVGRMAPGRAVGAVALLLVVTVACGSSEDGAGTADRLLVATTVSPLTNIVANVGGSAVEVRGIVPEGTNSHTFEPAPSVAELLAEADLVFVNGLQLEDPTVRLAEQNRKESAKLVRIGDEILPPDEYIFDFSFPKEEGKPNPHLWTDPTKVDDYAHVVARELAAADPENAEEFADNADAFAARVGDLDAALREATATLPRERRKLVTYHDAYAYFARSYGWTVVGAIQVDSFEDPSPREVARLVEQVREQGVKAIFGSEVFPSPVLELIGRETGVRYVDDLRDDDLPGEPGDPEHTLLSLLRSNYTTMITALGGDAGALAGVDVADVVDDAAAYPQ